MALQLIDTVAPCLNYELDTDGGSIYGRWLVTPPRIYQESINQIKQFFYDPVKDLYITFATLSYAYYPGWRMYRLVWNGADGSLNDDYTVRDGLGIIFTHWTNEICVGGYDKFYATGNSYLDVKEIDWVVGNWLDWACYDWEGHDPIAFAHAVVNRADNIIAGVGSYPLLFIYNYVTHALLGQVAIRDHGFNMAYESDKHLWLTHASGQLAKINYQTRRHEMLSRVANPAPEDITYRCAFDTNRKRLAILRHKTDAVDGACRLQLEFYNPVPQAQVITAPVPVNSLAAGKKITFSAHVLGDAGEGITSQAVTAELAAPAAGSLSSGRVMSGLNGAFAVEYSGPNDNAAETLTVSTEV